MSYITIRETRAALRGRRHFRMAERIERLRRNLITLVLLVIILVSVTR